METLPHWKRVWRAITGRSMNSSPSVVDDALELAKDHLLLGIATYPAYTEDSFTRCSEKVELKDHPDLSKFIRQLSVVLDLDACVTWSVFCNYLMFEYYGKVQDIEKLTNYETSPDTFITSIWQFYTLERSYLLRILQHIMENHRNTSHKFHQQYWIFIEDLTYTRLRESLFNQFSHLVKEIREETSTSIIEMNDMVERNNAELIQTLLLILSTIKHDKFEIAEFVTLFKLFKEHTFAPTSHQQEILKLSRPQVLESMQNVEFAIFIASVENFWFNQDEWYPQIDEIEKIVKEIFPSNNVSVVLLTWAALQSTLPNDLATLIYEQHSHMYVSKALENYVFKDLCKVISDPIFQDTIAGDVAKAAMYKLFDVLCIQFEARNVYVHEGAVSLLSQFLRTPDLAFSWKNMEGISAFFLHAVTIFPHHFEALSNFMEAFISLKEDVQAVIHELTKLKTFTEPYISPEQRGPYIRDNLLVRLYKPLDNDLIVFSPGARTSIVIKHGEALIQIHAEWNYFKLLGHVVSNFLDQVANTQAYEEQAQKIVLTGYKLILEILKVQPHLAWENEDIKNLLRLALCLLSISAKSRTKNLELLKMCFEITIHLFKRDPADVVRALIAIDFLPKLSEENMSPKDFDKAYLLSEATLLNHIEDEFSHSKSCDLLLLYIELVNEAIQLNVYYKKLQIPGFMFLLVKVFPVFVRHLFTDDLKKQKVLVELVSLMRKVLKRNPKSGQPEVTLYNCIMELFLNNKVYATSLMKIFECGNNKLQLLLTTEMNWENGPLLVVVNTIRRALDCVLLMLDFIKLNGPEKYRLFEELLYWWEPSSFSVLKVISSYMNHCFDPKIPKVACKILTAFVKISNSPLLHSLQLDDYQLQSLFLERLRDTLDDQQIRVAVVRLVTVCVNDQSSMTSGFFNMAPKGEYSDVSVLSFIEECLETIEKNPNSLLIPIQGAILDLFHELWKNNKQHLLRKLTDHESFWISLATPLLKPNSVPVENLLQILEIIVLEMHYSKRNTNDNKFAKAFKTIFANSRDFLNMWMDRLMEVSQQDTLLTDSSNLPLCMALLTIWKNFMLSVKLLYSKFFEREWNKPFLLQKCLKGLLRYTEGLNKVEILTLWAELLLVFVKFPTLEDSAEKTEIFNCLTKIVNNLSKFYEVVDGSCRTVMLTVITIVVTNFKEFLLTNPTFIVPFLTPLEKIFYFEFKVTFADKSLNEVHYRNWVLVLRIIRTFLQFDTFRDCEYFFIHIRFVERMTEVLGVCVIFSLPARVAEVTAMALVEFAESPFIQHFEYLNLLQLSERLLPPKALMLQKNSFPNGIIPRHLKDWWTIYLYIVRLNCTLLRRRKGHVSKHILEFVYVHQTILADGLLSATVLADSTNLELVNEILRFIYAVLEYKQEWIVCHVLSFSRVMVTIKEVLNASIGVILRPKCLIFVPNNAQSGEMQVAPTVPTQNLINVTNSYLEIITWACKCFTRCNPPFVNLLNMYRPTNFQVFVEYDFRVPTAMEESTQVLTYGSLLCALHFVCKVLSQMFFQEKERFSESSHTTPKGDASLFSTPSTVSMLSLTPETPSCKTDEEQYFNVLIMPSYTKETAESISVLHSFTVPDIMGLQAPWLINLNTDTLMLTLNALTTFLAGQAFLTVRDDGIERNLKRYVKRELCSELSLFYDFVIKYLGDKYAPTDDDQSVIGGSDARVMATPRRAHSKSKIRTRERLFSKIGAETKLVVDVLRICTERQSGRRIEMVDIEDCYLLTLVHWFRHVCCLVHYSKFDEFLSRWHAKSTYVMPHSTFVKNTSVHLSDDEDEMK